MNRKLIASLIATAVLAAPFTVRAEPGADEHLQPKPWKHSATMMGEKMKSARIAAPLPSAFEAALNAQ